MSLEKRVYFEIIDRHFNCVCMYRLLLNYLFCFVFIKVQVTHFNQHFIPFSIPGLSFKKCVLPAS